MAKKITQIEILTPEVETLPASLQTVVTESKLTLSKAQSHALSLAPFMTKINELSEPLSKMDKVNPSPEDAKLARETRLKMVPNRTDAGRKKDDLKADLLIESNLIDGLFKVIENASKLTESEYSAIEKHQEKIESDRKNKLKTDRLALLAPFEVPGLEFFQLDEMPEDQFAGLLNNSKTSFETRQEAARVAEEKRIEAEKQALRLQAERIENERLEAIKIKAEKEELEKKFAEEQKRVDAENKKRDAELAAERKAAAELADKLAKENEAKIAEQARLAKIESDKQAAEFAKQKVIADKAAAELKVKQDAEAKIVADKLALQTASDKVKIRAMYDAIKALEIPELTSDAGKDIANNTRETIDALLKTIVLKSKSLV